MSELLLTGGRVLTMDPARPRAEALLVRGERIAAVGSAAELLALASPAVRRLDLAGRCLIPGFNDNHLHALSMGEYFSRVRVHGLGPREILQVLRERFAGARRGRILWAYGWDYPQCPSPHRSLLDEAFPDNPVVLYQFSGHAAWVNSAMLARLGIRRRTPDPVGGEIARGPDGEPTGILRDAAIYPLHLKRMRRHVFNRELRARLLDACLVLLSEAGITSVQDNTWVPTTVWLLNEYRRSGRLTCRFTCWAYGNDCWMRPLMGMARYDRAWVRRGPWKYLMDGTFSTHTAWMLEPYSGEPENFGKPNGTPADLLRIVRQAARARRQVAFHAIGDRTIRGILDAVQEVGARRPGLQRLRLRLEHAQIFDPADIPRLAELGVLVAAQPTALGSPEKDAAILGPERAARAYPFASLLAAGARLSFGSDFPGEIEYRPLEAIHRAVNRPRPERISAEQALACYTRESAYAEFMETEKGSLAPGMLADLVVLSQDPTTVAPERIRDTQVQMTFVGGKPVFERPM
jgi:predicted amidohydrolase YtcJ